MRSATLLLATLLLAPTTVRAQRDPCAGVSGHMIDGDDDRTTIVVAERGRCLEVRMTGRVTFTDDDADVRTLDRGATLVATERRGGTTRVLTLVDRGGTIERTYAVDGAMRPVAESAEWFGTIVLDLVRGTGYGAEERVARIRARGGVSAVLDEIPRLRSSHVRRVYLEQLLAGGGLADADVRRVAEVAREQLESDHDRAVVLRAVAAERGADHTVADAIVRGAASIGSDHDRSTVLQALLERTTIEAFDRAVFLRAVDAMGSDHERRLALVAAAQSDALGADAVRALVASAARLGSDHEKAIVLLAIATPAARLRDPSTRAAFDAALRTLGSDAEYRRVASAVVR